MPSLSLLSRRIMLDSFIRERSRLMVYRFTDNITDILRVSAEAKVMVYPSNALVSLQMRVSSLPRFSV